MIILSRRKSGAWREARRLPPRQDPIYGLRQAAKKMSHFIWSPNDRSQNTGHSPGGQLLALPVPGPTVKSIPGYTQCEIILGPLLGAASQENKKDTKATGWLGLGSCQWQGHGREVSQLSPPRTRSKSPSW